MTITFDKIKKVESRNHFENGAKPKSQVSREPKLKNMESIKENSNVVKQRHGCVTTWLVIMIITNSLIAITYLFASNMIIDNLPGDVATSMIILLGIIGIANVVFSVLLLQWKKFAFWGFAITSFVTFFINLSIDIGIAQSVFGLVGIAILYGIMQIKKDNITAWSNLE